MITPCDFTLRPASKHQNDFMKKIAVITGLAFALTASVYGQDAQIRIKVKEAEIPAAVVQSFKKDFASGQAEEWTIVPAALVAEEYIISGYDNLNGEKPTSYEVRIKGPGIKGEAVYSQDGKLLYSKEVIKDTALPAQVVQAVVSKYPGYNLTRDEETIWQGKAHFIHYRVIIKKEKESWVLAVDANGKILRDKKVVL
jgi:hypothetical protein